MNLVNKSDRDIKDRKKDLPPPIKVTGTICHASKYWDLSIGRCRNDHHIGHPLKKEQLLRESEKKDNL